jgi:hypothetical protein
MNDDHVIERVRAAVESRVAGVREQAPDLLPDYASNGLAPASASVSRGRGSRTMRWVVPVALAAAAAVVLGFVVVTVGDDVSDQDVAPVTDPPSASTSDPSPDPGTAPSAELERWVLEADGAVLLGAEDATTSATAIGTSVYFGTGADRLSGAVARTNGASIGQARSSWPVLETVSVLGATATRYGDDGRELLVVNVQPSLIVETYGVLDAVELAGSAVLADGVWMLNDGSVAEVGRRTEADGAFRYSGLTYVIGATEQRVTVVRHPAGVIGAVLDSAVVPAERVTDREGTPFLLLAATSMILDRAGTDVVTVEAKMPDDLSILAGEAVLRQVDEATWSDLVASVRPDLGPPVTFAPPESVIPTVPEGGPGPVRYQAIGLFIEVPGEGVELCLGAILDSLPPQCDGVPISAADWRWPDTTFEESNGVRWARYFVEGTYDGSVFVPAGVTRVPTPADEALWPQEAGDFSTPCPKPAQGWLAMAANAPNDESAAESALAAVVAYAEGQAGYGATWIDQSINDAAINPSANAEGLMSDPRMYVVNVSFTGDLDGHRAAIEALWSGAVCVSEAARSQEELQAIEAIVRAEPGILEFATEGASGTVRARFVLAEPDLQARFDAAFGPGAVEVTSALLPLGE